MTVAVLLPAVSVIPIWVLIAGVVLAAGLAPVATWIARTMRSELARRFLLAFVLAVVLSLTVGVTQAYAVAFGPCESPYWYFWWC